MASREDWRTYKVFDLMIELMSDWRVEDIEPVISNLPLIPVTIEKTGISENAEPSEDTQSDSAEVVYVDNDEPDFNHPSSFFGYMEKVSELLKSEEKIERLITPITAVSYSPNGHTRLGRQDEGLMKETHGEVMLEMPYRPHGVEWFPDEVGALVGRVLADEWDLRFVIQLLTNLAIIHYSAIARFCRWEEYLGFVGIMLSSAMSVNRHWENEDIMWVYKDFCIDVGKWAMNMWDDFRELEYREWIADVICLVAIRRNDTDHDSKLIALIMDELCESWDYERSDVLSWMIEHRMKTRSFPTKQISDAISFLGLKTQLPLAVHGRSLLWSPPEEYYLPEKWEESHERMLTESRDRMMKREKLLLKKETKDDPQRVEEGTSNQTEQLEKNATSEKTKQHEPPLGSRGKPETDATKQIMKNPEQTENTERAEQPPEREDTKNPEKEEKYKWMVTRIDSLDNKYFVKAFESKEHAIKLQEHYINLGHHQHYYVEPYSLFRDNLLFNPHRE
eukprot:TRINITY_DN13096_c0_g1_i3.p1 TRINITY_DN13096_c0_g1~~TRINITY_DN13096_c0_g1_i3.p1  ORF type:complete len:506 (-),score=122.45 TRINITY_DN13096_c0_g1_i3:81-1598(-)